MKAMDRPELRKTQSLRPRDRESFASWWETQPFCREDVGYTKGESIYLSLQAEWALEEQEELESLFSYGERGTERVVLEEKLGEGGMGEVWSAWQASLHREVAVKRLKIDDEAGKMRSKLLREARTTGMLEHPNIVPVHLLGCDEGRAPAFAMKRIQGVSWEDLIHGKEPMPTGLQGATPLERHIRILKHVCNAIHFAHSRGVVHRDLKPSNVMVGAFGEVYVMDWGIAVTLGAERPLAKEEGIFGTPAYMAPEMAMGLVEEIGTHTDVYLLGALLHELLTGDAPHDGDSLYEVLFSATQSVPYEYEPTVPVELVDICHRAMHAEPSLRYPNAEAFRTALAGFLTHRTSRQLSLETMARSVQLKAHLKADMPISEDDAMHIYHLFGQVRFGFQQALRTWDGNQQAQAGLQEALEQMIRFELAQGHSRAASVLLPELPSPNPLLETEIRSLIEDQEASQAELDAYIQHHHDTDLSVESTSRGYLMWMMALLWGLFPLIVELFGDIGWLSLTIRSEILISGISVLGSLVCVWWWRQSLGQNEINRNILMALILAIFTLSLLWLMCLRLGLALPMILTLEAIPMFGFFAFVAVLVDRRLVPVLWLYGGVAVLSLALPPIAPYATSCGNMAAFVMLGWIWQQSQGEVYPNESDITAAALR